MKEQAIGRYVYKLSDIGEGIAEAEIVKWHAEPGAAITQDQPLVYVMTDKATVEIAAVIQRLSAGAVNRNRRT